jgi:serine/threonine-protein kinase
MRASAELSPGTLVSDRYWVQRTLGYGSCGCTYLVYDKENSSQPYVLKEFAPTDSRESVIEKCYSLFEQEAQVLCKLKHPQIPQCFGFFEDKGRLFLVQEYIDGKTYWEILQERLARGQVFSETETIQWLKDLLPVLDNIHSCRIIHRDISPDNVMLPNGGGKPVLIDFGVVKQVMTQIGSQIISHPTSSVGGTMVGKAGYSPPEQLRLGHCYPNSDLYSLAVTALVLLSGKHPSELCDGYSLKWQWRQYIKLGNSLSRIFDKMLAEVPKDRYLSARQVLVALSNLDRTQSKEREGWSETANLIAATHQTIVQHQKTSIQSETRIDKKKTSQRIALSSPTLPMRLLAMGFLISGSLIGGWVIGLQSPNLAMVCEIFNNCASDEPLKPISTTEAQTQPKTVENPLAARSLREWQEISDRSNKIVMPFIEVPQKSNRSTNSKSAKELADDREELTEKVQTRQTEVSELIAQKEENRPKVAPKPSESENPTAPSPTPVSSPPSDRNHTSESTLSERSSPTPPKPEATPTPQVTNSPTPENPNPTPKRESPKNPTPTPSENNPPAQTYQPGFWQPVARVNPKRSFQIELVNRTNAAIEYAVTTNEFPPRQLAANQSVVLTHVPLDANLLINALQSPTGKDLAASLQFNVTAADNVVTVAIERGKGEQAGDSTINIHITGAIYVF